MSSRKLLLVGAQADGPVLVKQSGLEGSARLAQDDVQALHGGVLDIVVGHVGLDVL